MIPFIIDRKVMLTLTCIGSSYLRKGRIQGAHSRVDYAFIDIFGEKRIL